MGEIETFEMELRPASAAQRWRGYFHTFRQPKMVVALVVIALFPVAIDQAPNLFLPSTPLSVETMIVGLSCVLVLLGVWLMVAETIAIGRALFGGSTTRLVFHEEGIRELRGRRTDEHPWTWITTAVQVGNEMFLSCHEPIRTLRLQRGSHRLITVDLRAEGAERWIRWLELRRPGLLHRTV